MKKMLMLNCENLSFSVGAKDILKNVSFSLDEGDKLGIVGSNGAGKSTLLRMIVGKYQPTDGAVFTKRGAVVEMLEQNDSVDSSKTPYEELLSCCKDLVEQEKRLEELQKGMEKGDEEAERYYHELHERFLRDGGYEYKGRIRGILRSLGFSGGDDDMPCEKLSGGQKTRLALARILFRAPDILILDEPTNHLDAPTLVWLEDFLRNYHKTVLVVSHDRYFLDRTVNKILDIDRGNAKLYGGNYSVFVDKKKKDREIAEKHYKNQQKEIARIESYIELQRQWNRERNIIAAESRQKALDRMKKLDKPVAEQRSIRLSFKAGIESGNDVLTVKGLTMGFSGKKLFENLNFEVEKGDRLFIIGHNGCGKSTLMKILMNRLPQECGSYTYGYNLTLGYYDQENQNLLSSNTVLDELWNTDPSLTTTKVRSALALFNFTGDDVGKSVSVLSGGERARLTFSKLVLRENNLLMLDEPTNHLDIASKEVLEEALTDYDGTVIAVSHDRYFINKLANRILDFDGPDGKPLFFRGTYEEYKNYRAFSETTEEFREKKKETVSDNKKQYLENKKAQAELRKMKSALERDEKEETDIEKRLEMIAREEETFSTDYQKLSELILERDRLEERLLELYEEMEELKEKLSKE